MGDIAAPRNLSNANAILSLADSFAKILDPSERKKIADDIREFHALNETEAKKAEDARSLIKKHTDILEETRRNSASNEQERKDISQERIQFNTEMEAARAKIAFDKSEAKTALDTAQKLHEQAVDIQDKANFKEKSLNQGLQDHQINVKKLEDDAVALGKQRDDIEKFKQEVLAMEKETKAKVEALKKYNF